MNNSLIKNLVFNLAVGAFVFSAFTYTSLSIEAVISLFTATGLLSIMAHDYRQSRQSKFEPARHAALVNRPVCCRAATLVAA